MLYIASEARLDFCPKVCYARAMKKKAPKNSSAKKKLAKKFVEAVAVSPSGKSLLMGHIEVFYAASGRSAYLRANFSANLEAKLQRGWQLC